MPKTKKKAKKVGRPKNDRGSHLERMLALAHSGKNEKEIAKYLKNNNHEKIEAHIEEAKKKFHSELMYSSYIEEFAMNRKFILSQLFTIYERAMEAEPVRDKDGVPTGEYKADFRTALKAVELMGRENGMFKANVVIDDMRRKDRAQEIIEQYQDVIDIKAERK